MDLTTVKELNSITKNIKKKHRHKERDPSKFLEANTRSAIYREASFLYSDFDNAVPPPPPEDSDEENQSDVSSVDSADHYLYCEETQLVESMKISEMNPTMQAHKHPKDNETQAAFFSEGAGEEQLEQNPDTSDDSDTEGTVSSLFINQILNSTQRPHHLPELALSKKESGSPDSFTISLKDFKFSRGTSLEGTIKELIKFMISEVVERRAVFEPIVEEEKKEPAPATSLLTNSVNKIVQAGGVIKRRFFIQPPEPSSNLRLQLKIYLLGTPQSLIITVSKANTVGELIKHILTCCDLDPSLEKTLIRYPDIPEAYELRLLEDDCDYEPDFEISPLDLAKKIGNFGQIDAIALTEVAGFNPAKYKRLDTLHQESLLILKKLTSNYKEKIGLRIYMRFNQAGLSSKVLLAKKDDTLREVLKKLEEKLDQGVLKPEMFYFTQHKPDPEGTAPSETENIYETELEEAYDMDTPVEILQTNEIELKRRLRRDEPMSSFTLQQTQFINTFDPRLTDFSKMQTYLEQALQHVGTLIEADEQDNPLQRMASGSERMFEDEGKDEEDFLFNENTANQYRQYIVVKINIRGKRQERVIAIDGHYIYNKKVFRKATMISSIIPDKFHFEKTHHTNWPIDEIYDFERVDPRKCRIRFKDEKKYNRLLLEFKTKTEASEFAAKLRFLLKKVEFEGTSRLPSVMI